MELSYAKHMLIWKGRLMSRLIKLLVSCLLLMMTIPLIAQDQATGAVYATGESVVTINVPRLNVRSEPSDTLYGTVVHTIAIQGERYPAEAFSRDGEWVLIRISGDTAWVLRSAVLLTNPENLPIIGEVTPEEDAAMWALTNQLVDYIKSTVGVRDNLNIRLAPGIQNPIIGRIPYPERAYPVNLFANGLWYQVEYQGTQGWVSAVYVTFPPGLVAPTITNNAQG